MKNKADYLADLSRTTRDLMTCREVAGEFAVSERTIWAWIARGDFPPAKRIGPRCRRWSVKELQAWIDDGCPSVRS
jgi:predicted DNA-binding transcriptional regulator AlpA